MSNIEDEWQRVWKEMQSRRHAALLVCQFTDMQKTVDAVDRLPFLENTGTNRPIIEMKNGIIGQAFATNSGAVFLLLGGNVKREDFDLARSVCESLGQIVEAIPPSKPWWRFW